MKLCKDNVGQKELKAQKMNNTLFIFWEWLVIHVSFISFELIRRNRIITQGLNLATSDFSNCLANLQWHLHISLQSYYYFIEKKILDKDIKLQRTTIKIQIRNKRWWSYVKIILGKKCETQRKWRTLYSFFENGWLFMYTFYHLN